jgi:hypothetical protein
VLFVDNPVGTGFSYVEEGANFSASCALLLQQHLVRSVWHTSCTLSGVWQAGGRAGWRAGGRMDRQTDGQTDRQTDRQNACK